MKNVLIIGGAGFIGANTASYFLKKGYKVFVLDNLSRKGSVANLGWLKRTHKELVFIKGDIRDFALLKKAVVGKDVIFHLAGQVAVTSSVANPREDFEINALGSFNVLEAARLRNPKAILVYSSTNKVYGEMEGEKVLELKDRYSFAKLKKGIPETYPLDFHSPYGCSKGTADQYFRDYFRIYGLKTVVFRQSCIYGPHQYGAEDQGWIAWFVIASLLKNRISIYGNGRQVRDILFIEDLIRAYDLAVEKIDRAQGQVYNLGGGPKNSISIWREFGPILENKLGKKIEVTYSAWRPGDQRIYISDTRKTKKDFGWQPKVGINEGLERLIAWVKENKKTIKKVVQSAGTI